MLPRMSGGVAGGNRGSGSEKRSGSRFITSAMNSAESGRPSGPASSSTSDTSCRASRMRSVVGVRPAPIRYCMTRVTASSARLLAMGSASGALDVVARRQHVGPGFGDRVLAVAQEGAQRQRAAFGGAGKDRQAPALDGLVVFDEMLKHLRALGGRHGRGHGRARLELVQRAAGEIDVEAVGARRIARDRTVADEGVDGAAVRTARDLRRAEADLVGEPQGLLARRALVGGPESDDV